MLQGNHMGESIVPSHRLKLSVLLCVGLATAACSAVDQAPASRQVHVDLGATGIDVASGRLLVFVENAKEAEASAKDGKVTEVDGDLLAPDKVTVIGTEVDRLAAGHGVDIHADAMSFPRPLAQLPPGDYYVQAVLDPDHSYNYTGRGAGDIVSGVVKMHWPSATAPTLKLTSVLPSPDPW